MNQHSTEDALARAMRSVADASVPRTERMLQRGLALGRTRIRRRRVARRSAMIAVAACVLAVIAIAGSSMVRWTTGRIPVAPVGTVKPTHPASPERSEPPSTGPSTPTDRFPVKLELKGWTCDPAQDQKTLCHHQGTEVQLTWRHRSDYPDWKAMSAGGEKITILGRTGRLWSGGAVAEPTKAGFLTVDNDAGAPMADLRRVAEAVVWA